MDTAHGFVDLQLNGYKGVDFNSDRLTGDALRWACEQLAADGVVGVLATITTDAIDRMARRLARLAALRRAEPLVQEIIWGLHIEGPFINDAPGYVGAHPPEHARPADLDVARQLLDAAEGLTRIVTLAPERDRDFQLTRLLAEQKIVVSAGHCDPSLYQLRGAIDAGLSMFTHLGNGCPMMLHRHDNIIQRALSVADRLWVCFIADGVHLPFPALGNFLRVVGPERAIVVTDATAAAGLGPGRYTLGNQTVEVGDDLVAWAPDRSHFVGATATMPQVASLLKAELGLSEDTVAGLLRRNPRRALEAAGLLS